MPFYLLIMLLFGKKKKADKSGTRNLSGMRKGSRNGSRPLLVLNRMLRARLQKSAGTTASATISLSPSV